MKFRELLAYFGGTACASAFHEYGHHDVSISTVLATITAVGVAVMIFQGPDKPKPPLKEVRVTKEPGKPMKVETVREEPSDETKPTDG